MSKLKDMMIKILSEYPHQEDMSNARLTKLIYLSDWHQAITHGSQISDIEWYFDNFGPFVWDVKEEAEENSEIFEIDNTRNMFGTKKTLISLKKYASCSNLSREELESVEHIIKTTASMGWDAFIKLVYSTYPVSSSPRYSILNLADKAKEYTATSKNSE